jgi:hypothetical protein
MLYPHEVAKMPVVGYGFVRMFDLSDPAQAEYYAWILDHAGNQLFSIDHIHRHPLEYTDANGNKAVKMFVHVEWRQFYTVPKKTTARGPTNDPRNYTLG